MVLRACPRCLAPAVENVRCPRHGHMNVWLVLDDFGRVVAVGTRFELRDAA